MRIDDADRYLDHQLKDLSRAAARSSDWFKGITVEKYLAMRRDNVVSFHALD